MTDIDRRAAEIAKSPGMKEAASTVTKQIEEAVHAELLAKNRFDLLDALRDNGYLLRKRPDGPLEVVVAGEVVMVITIGPGGDIRRMN
jgi:hypothetical protein